MSNEKIKIYFINKTKKSVGHFWSLFVIRTPIENGNTKVQATFERPNTKDKIEYYFNEAEWIEDVKKL